MFFVTFRNAALTAAAAMTLATFDAAGAAAGADRQGAATDVLVQGKSFKITRQQLKDEIAPSEAAAKIRGQELGAGQMAQLQTQALDGMISMELFAARAKDEDRARAKADSELLFSQIVTNMGGPEELKRQLTAAGMNENALRQRLLKQSLMQAVIERELDLKITDAQAKAEYEKILKERPSQLEERETVRASHILLATRDMATGSDLSEDKKAEKKKLAESLVKRARDGEDFAKLAKEFSEDPGSKDKGGEYTFPRGQMVEEFETTAFNLKTNEVSDVVTTVYGYHVIKVLEKIPARTVDYAKVEAQIKMAMKNEEFNKRGPAYLDKVRKEGEVEILDTDLKKEIEAGWARSLSATNAPAAAADK